MKVVCIKDFKSTPIQHELTLGKTYKVIKMAVYAELYTIECDRGFLEDYHLDFFIPLEDYREGKIDKILG